MGQRRTVCGVIGLISLLAQMGWAQVDFTTLSNKVMTGYQGWHWATGDGSPYNTWNHWITNRFARPGPTNVHMDMFPDMTEYTNQYNTDFYTPGGTRMKVYSATDSSTVNLHFKWMRDYNIDGAFVQRFVSRFKDPNSTRSQNTDIVLSNCWKAAEAYGRSFVVMYDVSDSWSSDSQLYTTITTDWINRAKKYTNSPNYQHHKGKPLAVVWGMGKTDRWPKNPVVAMDIVNFFKTNGCTLMGGVDDDWRTLNGGLTNVVDGVSWTDVNNAYDVISPWLVGTFGAGVSAADGIKSKLSNDVVNCTARGVDYMPVVFPGFSWANWQPGAVFNSRPRLGGTYLWRQAYNAKDAGANMVYLAMFDEVDEATALYKTTATASTSPRTVPVPGYGTNQWVTIDIDGQALPSDWYLKVCCEINRMFKGERPPVGSLPITTNSAPTITSSPVTAAKDGHLYSYTLMVTNAVTHTLSYSSVLLPAWLSFNTNTAVLSGTPTTNDLGTNAVILQVSDLYGSTNQSFSIWVSSFGNEVPVITSIPNTGVIESQSYSYTFSATDGDQDLLTYNAATKPAWLSFNTGTRVLSGVPASSNVGLNRIDLTVTDGLVTVTQQFNIAVFSTPSPAVLVQNGSFELGSPTPSSWTIGGTATSSTNIFQHGVRSLQIQSPATIVPTRQTLTVQVGMDYQYSVWIHAAGVTNSSVVFDTGYPGIGKVVVSSNAGWSNYTGTITATSTSLILKLSVLSSSFGGVAYVDNITLDPVIVPNNPPVVTSIPVTDAVKDVMYSYTLLAADVENSPLVYAGVTVPAWLSFNTNSGVLSGIPVSTNVGSHPVALRVSDGSLSVTQNFAIVVASSYADWAEGQGEIIGAPTVDYDTDGRNNLYEYALDGDPTNDQDHGIDPAFVMTGDGFEYAHLRRLYDASLAYIVETRTNLVSGGWATTGSSALRTNSYNVEYDQVTYRIATTNDAAYIRLRIEQQ